MGDVLHGAAALCLCKLACSFLSVPSLSTSHSSVSLCCCCLLVFTDFLVTVFLSFLCIFQSWLPEATGDVIALRFLLFLSHMYGAVLLLITPLIAVETLSRLLGPRRTAGRTADSGGRCLSTVTVETEEQKESSNLDEDKRLFHIVGYLCCLSVWVTVALNVRWRWKLEEVWSAVCLHTTSSLIRCLPKLLNHIPVVVDPCWGMVFLFLLLLLLIINTHWAPAQTETTHTTKNGGRDLVPVASASSKPGMSVSDPAQSVDPETTRSSCTLHRVHFWNNVQLLAHHHGDTVRISSGCLSAERRGQKHERTKGATTLTFLPVEHKDPQHMSQCGWSFPCLGVSVTIGLVSIVLLPLNLSVNVFVIRTVETLLELCVRSLLSFTSHTVKIPSFHEEMLV